MALPDTRTNDELRASIRTGDAPDRVYAAFELGRRLGAEVTRDLDLPAQADSGVRRNWLTILASFGERDAVRAIAEAHVGGPEGEHALHLAIQLGITDPAWLADRFNQTTERMQGAILDREDGARSRVNALPPSHARSRRGSRSAASRSRPFMFPEYHDFPCWESWQI